MGRTPKPKASKQLDNNPGKRRIPEPVKPPPGVPDMPKGLPALAKNEWKRVTPILDKMGVLSILDRAALADYCLCVARVTEIEKVISRDGLSVRGRNRGAGHVKNPLLSVARQYRSSLQRWCDLFGFAPGPRGRLDVPEQIGEDDPEGMLD